MCVCEYTMDQLYCGEKEQSENVMFWFPTLQKKSRDMFQTFLKCSPLWKRILCKDQKQQNNNNHQWKQSNETLARG